MIGTLNSDHSESDDSDDEDEDEEVSAGKGKEAEPDTEEVDLTHLLKDGPKAQTHIMNNYFSIGTSLLDGPINFLYILIYFYFSY